MTTGGYSPCWLSRGTYDLVCLPGAASPGADRRPPPRAGLVPLLCSPAPLLEGELPGSAGRPRRSPVTTDRPPGLAQPGPGWHRGGGSSSRGLRGAGAEMPLPLTSPRFLCHICPSPGQSVEHGKEDHTRPLISPAFLPPHLPPRHSSSSVSSKLNPDPMVADKIKRVMTSIKKKKKTTKNIFFKVRKRHLSQG